MKTVACIPCNRPWWTITAVSVGFCTPGIVMSLYALWMTNPEPGRSQIEEALQGNLCRCTGYAPIIRAAVAISDYGSPLSDWLERERKTNFKRLIDLHDGARVVLEAEGKRAILPANLDDFSHVRLEEPLCHDRGRPARMLALWVTKEMRDLHTLIFIGHLEGHEGGHLLAIAHHHRSGSNL